MATGQELPVQPVPDSLNAPPAATYRTLRGLERDEFRPTRPLRHAVNAMFWAPRTAVDLVLAGAGVSAVLIDENRIISKFEDIFYIYDRKLGWFPIFNVVTGFPRGYGLSVFYKDNYYQSYIRGAYSNSEIWGAKAKAEWTLFLWKRVWQIEMSGRLQNDNNYRFYGIGADPTADARSHFRPGQTPLEYGIYQQRHIILEGHLGIRPTPDLEIFIATQWLERTISNPAGGGERTLSNVFDTDRLPGYLFEPKKWYTELALRVDTRDNLDRIVPGFRSEAYTGVGIGRNEDPSNLFRGGVDAAWFIPVLRRNRLLIPRLVFDMTEPLNDAPIPFTEYPRPVAFRGVHRKELLRNDRYALVSSIAYQWPLTHNLDGHLFFDHVTVGRTPGRMTMSEMPWAVGLGADIHTRYAELARVYIAYGSEGIFARGTIGLSSMFKDRSDWH